MPEPTPPVLLPHVWIQPTGFGPNMYAGQIMTADGKIPYYGRTQHGEHYKLVPVRLAPHTKAGLQQLATQLRQDIDKTRRGAA